MSREKAKVGAANLPDRYASFFELFEQLPPESQLAILDEVEAAEREGRDICLGKLFGSLNGQPLQNDQARRV